MTNEEFITTKKSLYESLRDINVLNNHLVYQNYSVPLDNLSIEKIFSFCPGLFNLEPADIIKVIYTCKLLSKNELTDIETNYLINYTKSYLNIKKYLLNNMEYIINGTPISLETLERDIKGFELPILFSDDDAFKNSMGASIIRKELDSYYNSMDNGGMEKDLQRVRKKNGISSSDPSLDRNYLEYQEFHDKLNSYQNAGFVTIFLIGFTIITTLIVLMMIK